MLMLVGLFACTSHKAARALSLSLAHPDDSAKRVEYFLEKPSSVGPWPTVVFLHGHQEWPREGAYDFVKWGVLDQFAKRGYLAVAVSQPGYTYTSIQEHAARLDRLLRLPDSELRGLVAQNKNIRWKLLAIRAAYIRPGIMGKY